MYEWMKVDVLTIQQQQKKSPTLSRTTPLCDSSWRIAFFCILLIILSYWVTAVFSKLMFSHLLHAVWYNQDKLRSKFCKLALSETLTGHVHVDVVVLAVDGCKGWIMVITLIWELRIIRRINNLELLVSVNNICSMLLVSLHILVARNSTVTIRWHDKTKRTVAFSVAEECMPNQKGCSKHDWERNEVSNYEVLTRALSINEEHSFSDPSDFLTSDFEIFLRESAQYISRAQRNLTSGRNVCVCVCVCVRACVHAAVCRVCTAQHQKSFSPMWCEEQQRARLVTLEDLWFVLLLAVPATVAVETAKIKAKHEDSKFTQIDPSVQHHRGHIWIRSQYEW